MSDDALDDDGHVPASGAAARARRLGDGIVARATRVGGVEEREESGARVLIHEGKVVARIVAEGGTVVVDLDSRAGVGDGVALRRLGSPHPDRERSAAGWRRVVVRRLAEASRVASALRAPRESDVGDAPASRRVREIGPYALDVGGIRVRRLLDPTSPRDGQRVFVDAQWPDRAARDRADVALWLPEAAPSPRVRQAFGDAPAAKAVFRRAYLSELRGSSKAEVVSRLRHLARKGPLTLLTAVREVRASPAVVLARAVSQPRTPTV
jgi:uncharacterized protein YeaO (DUF488 family)